MKYLPVNNFRNKIFSRTLLSYIAVISISLIMLGLLSYSYIASLTEKHMEDMYQRALEDVKSSIENEYQDLYTLSVQISSMYWAKKYIYSDPLKLNYDTLDVIETNNIINELTMFATTSPMISGIAMYINNKDMVLSTFGRETGTRFFQSCIKYEGKKYDDWMKLLNSPNTASIILPHNAKIYGSSCKVLTYVQSLPLHYKSFNASLIYFIDVEKFEKKLKSNATLEDCSISILSTNYSLIAGEALTKENMETLKKSIEKSTSDNGSNHIIKLNNNSSIYLLSSRSSISGWYYVTVVHKTKSMNTVQKIKMIMLLIGIAYMLLGVLTAFILACQNYKPINHIISLCSSKLYKESDWKMDFDLLEKSIVSMIADKKRDEKKIEIYKPIARNAWLAGLIKGENKIDSNFDELSHILDIKLDKPNFLCAALKLEKKYILGDRPFEILYENLKSEKVTVYFCDLDMRSKAVIINFNNDVDGYSIAEDFISYLEQIGLTLSSAGLSQIFNDISRIPEAFNEAQIALNRKALYEDGKIVVYKDWSTVDDSFTTISPQEDIICCLKAGAAREAYDISMRFADQSIIQRKMNLHQLKYMYYSFASMGLKALNEMNILEHPSIYPEQMFSTDDIEKLRSLLLEFYNEVTSIIKEQKQKGSETLITSIIEYITDNIASNQLCLMTIAAHFDLSPSYLSRYFKSRTNINLTEFINEKRIELSKQYLAEGYSVLETARMVGYENDITFRRIFKKMTGITPGKYEGA